MVKTIPPIWYRRFESQTQRQETYEKAPTGKPEKADHLKTKEGLMEELPYLRAQMAVLKKLNALIQEKEVRRNEAGSSRD